MRFVQTAVVCGIFIFFGNIQARADWQYSRWGMSIDELMIAGNGAAFYPQQARDYKGKALHLASAYYSAGNFTFDVVFLFEPSTKKLDNVTLVYPKKDTCYELLGPLQATYGPPKESRTQLGRIFKWWDQTNGNLIVFSDVSGIICDIQYLPIKEGNAAGGL